MLQAKIALVTGGDSGIGRAVGVHFSQEGATVAFTYVPGLEDKDAEDTVNLLKEAKTEGAKDPLKIPVDLGYVENCKKVNSLQGLNGLIFRYSYHHSLRCLFLCEGSLLYFSVLRRNSLFL